MLGHLVVLIKIRIVVAPQIFGGSILSQVRLFNFSMFIWYTRPWSFGTLLERIEQSFRWCGIIRIRHDLLSGAPGIVEFSLPFIGDVDTNIVVLNLLLLKGRHLLSVLSSCYDIFDRIIYKSISFVSCLIVSYCWCPNCRIILILLLVLLVLGKMILLASFRGGFRRLMVISPIC